MANTQGLTDEEMLQSMNETVVRGWTATARLDNTSSSPAAKVVRKSNNRAVKLAIPPGKHYMATPDDAKNGVQDTAPPAAVLVGSIVERKPQPRRRRQRAAATKATAGGFPSLQRPLGTFTAAATKVVVPVPSPSRNNDNTTTATTTSGDHPDDDDDNLQALQQVSARDADRMLANMSVQEIQESAQELKSLLTPETLRFLQHRNKNNNTTKNHPPATTTQTNSATRQKNEVTTTSATAKEEHTATTSSSIQQHPNNAERLEKERVAQLLANVQTYDDMDALYRAEMGHHNKDDEMQFVPSSSSNNNNTDPFLVACDLLRSTVPRQALWGVRHVRDQLTRHLQQHKSDWRLPHHHADTWPFPTVLPVSLRCLLDQPPNPNNGFLLHTYALQALYSLLRLRCAEEHDVNLTAQTDSDDMSSLYPLVLADDAVPSPSNVYKSSTNAVQPISMAGVAYATSSSTESATQDGIKFAQDPLWTLLSQMRILPRLASLLQQCSNIPVEAVVATAGLLSMLAQRSPGAATAMVQHKTLLTDVLARVMDARAAEQQPPPSMNMARSLLAVVRLWTVLARQSRTAAAGLVELPPWGMILGIQRNTVEGKLLQRWTLVLWRTLLRYGLAMQEVEAMLTLAAPHVSVWNSNSSTPLLAADYLSCWSMVLRLHLDRVTQAVDASIREHEIRQLVKVRSWLTSCYRQAVSHIASRHAKQTVSLLDKTPALVLLSACLRFCHQYFVTEDVVTPNPPGEFKSEESTVEDEARCLDGLRELVASGVVKSAVSVLASHAFEMGTEPSDEREAAVVSFLNEYTSMLRVLQKRSDERENSHVGHSLKTLTDSLSKDLVDRVTQAAAQKLSVVVSLPPKLGTLGVRNGGRFLLLELMRLTCNTECVHPTVRAALGVSAVGWMQVGDEALLDRLLRMEVIHLPLELRSMVLGQQQSSQQRRLQLEHSSLLHRDVLPNQSGTTELQSLRSEADGTGSQRDESNNMLLPMGEYWLWKVLAGSASPETPPEQIIRVLNATLSLVDELEKAATGGLCHFTQSLESGSRMYYIMNICTVSEEIIGNDSIANACDRLRLVYSRLVDDGFVRSFAEACVGHSSLSPLGTSSNDSKGGVAEDSTVSDEEKKLADALLDEKTDPDVALSGKRLRIVMAFVNDLCTSFCDYGAQFDFAGPMFRVFLYPAFPSQVRCEVIRRLQGLLHLLSSPMEDADAESLARFLREPHADGDTLDTLALCFAKSTSNRREGFFGNFVIASLGMSLATGVKTGRLELQRRRLANVQPTVLAQIARAARFRVSQEPGLLDFCAFVIEQDQDTSQEEQMGWDEVATLFA